MTMHAIELHLVDCAIFRLLNDQNLISPDDLSDFCTAVNWKTRAKSPDGMSRARQGLLLSHFL
jgi:hypothetical protein